MFSSNITTLYEKLSAGDVKTTSVENLKSLFESSKPTLATFGDFPTANNDSLQHLLALGSDNASSEETFSWPQIQFFINFSQISGLDQQLIPPLFSLFQEYSKYSQNDPFQFYDNNLDQILLFYFNQRKSIFDTFFTLIRISNSSSHPYHKISRDFLDSFENPITENLMKQYLKLNQNLKFPLQSRYEVEYKEWLKQDPQSTKLTPTVKENKPQWDSSWKYMTEQRLILWITQKVSEQEMINQCILYFYYFHIISNVDEILKILDYLTKIQFGLSPVNQNSPLSNPEIENHIHRSWEYCCLLSISIFNLEFIFTKNNPIDHWLLESSNLSKLDAYFQQLINNAPQGIISNLQPKAHCFVFFCFGIILGFAQDNDIETKALDASIYLQFSQDLDMFANWDIIFKKISLFPNEQYFLAIKSILKGLLFAFLSVFEVTQINSDELPAGIYRMAATVYTNNLDNCRAFWSNQINPTIKKSLLQLVCQQFPLDTRPFLLLLSSLIGFPHSSFSLSMSDVIDNVDINFGYLFYDMERYSNSLLKIDGFISTLFNPLDRANLRQLNDSHITPDLMRIKENKNIISNCMDTLDFLQNFKSWHSQMVVLSNHHHHQAPPLIPRVTPLDSSLAALLYLSDVFLLKLSKAPNGFSSNEFHQAASIFSLFGQILAPAVNDHFDNVNVASQDMYPKLQAQLSKSTLYVGLTGKSTATLTNRPLIDILATDHDLIPRLFLYWYYLTVSAQTIVKQFDTPPKKAALSLVHFLSSILRCISAISKSQPWVIAYCLNIAPWFYENIYSPDQNMLENKQLAIDPPFHLEFPYSTWPLRVAEKNLVVLNRPGLALFSVFASRNCQRMPTSQQLRQFLENQFGIYPIEYYTTVIINSITFFLYSKKLIFPEKSPGEYFYNDLMHQPRSRFFYNASKYLSTVLKFFLKWSWTPHNGCRHEFGISLLLTCALVGQKDPRLFEWFLTTTEGSGALFSTFKTSPQALASQIALYGRSKQLIAQERSTISGFFLVNSLMEILIPNKEEKKYQQFLSVFWDWKYSTPNIAHKKLLQQFGQVSSTSESTHHLPVIAAKFLSYPYNPLAKIVSIRCLAHYVQLYQDFGIRFGGHRLLWLRNVSSKLLCRPYKINQVNLLNTSLTLSTMSFLSACVENQFSFSSLLCGHEGCLPSFKYLLEKTVSNVIEHDSSIVHHSRMLAELLALLLRLWNHPNMNWFQSALNRMKPFWEGCTQLLQQSIILEKHYLNETDWIPKAVHDGETETCALSWRLLINAYIFRIIGQDWYSWLNTQTMLAYGVDGILSVLELFTSGQVFSWFDHYGLVNVQKNHHQNQLYQSITVLAQRIGINLGDYVVSENTRVYGDSYHFDIDAISNALDHHINLEKQISRHISIIGKTRNNLDIQQDFGFDFDPCFTRHHLFFEFTANRNTSSNARAFYAMQQSQRKKLLSDIAQLKKSIIQWNRLMSVSDAQNHYITSLYDFLSIVLQRHPTLYISLWRMIHRLPNSLSKGLIVESSPPAAISLVLKILHSIKTHIVENSTFEPTFLGFLGRLMQFVNGFFCSQSGDRPQVTNQLYSLFGAHSDIANIWFSEYANGSSSSPPPTQSYFRFPETVLCVVHVIECLDHFTHISNDSNLEILIHFLEKCLLLLNSLCSKIGRMIYFENQQPGSTQHSIQALVGQFMAKLPVCIDALAHFISQHTDKDSILLPCLGSLLSIIEFSHNDKFWNSFSVGKPSIWNSLSKILSQAFSQTFSIFNTKETNESNTLTTSTLDKKVSKSDLPLLFANKTESLPNPDTSLKQPSLIDEQLDSHANRILLVLGCIEQGLILVPGQTPYIVQSGAFDTLLSQTWLFSMENKATWSPLMLYKVVSSSSPSPQYLHNIWNKVFTKVISCASLFGLNHPMYAQSLLSTSHQRFEFSLDIKKMSGRIPKGVSKPQINLNSEEIDITYEFDIDENALARFRTTRAALEEALAVIKLVTVATQIPFPVIAQSSSTKPNLFSGDWSSPLPYHQRHKYPPFIQSLLDCILHFYQWTLFCQESPVVLTRSIIPISIRENAYLDPQLRPDRNKTFLESQGDWSVRVERSTLTPSKFLSINSFSRSKWWSTQLNESLEINFSWLNSFLKSQHSWNPSSYYFNSIVSILQQITSNSLTCFLQTTLSPFSSVSIIDSLNMTTMPFNCSLMNNPEEKPSMSVLLFDIKNWFRYLVALDSHSNAIYAKIFHKLYSEGQNELAPFVTVPPKMLFIPKISAENSLPTLLGPPPRVVINAETSLFDKKVNQNLQIPEQTSQFSHKIGVEPLIPFQVESYSAFENETWTIIEKSLWILLMHIEHYSSKARRILTSSFSSSSDPRKALANPMNSLSLTQQQSNMRTAGSATYGRVSTKSTHSLPLKRTLTSHFSSADRQSPFLRSHSKLGSSVVPHRLGSVAPLRLGSIATRDTQLNSHHRDSSTISNNVTASSSSTLAGGTSAVSSSDKPNAQSSRSLRTIQTLVDQLAPLCQDLCSLLEYQLQTHHIIINEGLLSQNAEKRSISTRLKRKSQIIQERAQFIDQILSSLKNHQEPS